MRQENLIAIKIQQFLNSVDQTDNPEYVDVAKQFAEMCRDLNARLEKCKTDIQNGACADAIYFAEAEPPILEMVDVLGFADVDEWNEICNLYDWQIAPQIQADLVAVLKDVYSDHSSLEPLLNEYRKKSKTALLKDKIHLLRRIRGIDAKNPKREEDLVRFENERLQELKKDARKAIETEDETAIKNIYLEMTSPEWFVKAPENVVSKMARELAQYRKLRLKTRGQNILHELTNAYSNFDSDGVEIALKKWEMILNEDEFVPKSSDSNQVKEAQEWFDRENSELDKTAAFERIQKELSEDMEHKKDMAELDNKYHKLTEFGKPIPENLLKRYRQVRSDLELDEHRTHSKKLLTSVLLILAVIAGLAYFIHLQIKGKEYNKWTAPIIEASKSDNLIKLKAAAKNIEDLKEKEPGFYDSKVIQAESTIHSRIMEIETRIKDFENIIKQLKEIKKNNFEAYDTAIDLVKRVELLLKKIGTDERIAEFNRIKISLKAYEIKTQDVRDHKFRLGIASLGKLLSAVQIVDAEKEPEIFAKELKQYEDAGNQMLASKGISAELMQDNKKSLEGHIDNLQTELTQALEKNKERRKLFNRIEANVLPLITSKLLLTQFVSKFPLDSETVRFKKILNMMPAYLNAIMLKNLNPETFAKTELEKYTRLLKDHPASDIWRDDLNKFLLYNKMFFDNSEKVTKTLSNLKALRIMKLKVFRFKDKNGDKYAFYTEDKKIERKFSQINDKRYCRLKAAVLLENGQAGTPFTFLQKDKGWTVKSGKNTLYNKLKQLDPIEKRVPVAKHVSFCATANLDIALKKPAEYQLFLMNKIEELKKDDQINPYIRLQFLEKFFSMAKGLTISNKKIYERHETDIKQFMKAAGQLNWYELPKEVKQRFEQRINDIPDLRARAAKELFESNMINDALGRRIKAVAYIQDNKGVKNIVIKEKKQFSEIWALKEKEGVLHFIVIGSVRDGKPIINPKFIKGLFDSEPLFAPMDERSTQNLTDSLKNDATVTTEWPHSWPENMK